MNEPFTVEELERIQRLAQGCHLYELQKVMQPKQLVNTEVCRLHGEVFKYRNDTSSGALADLCRHVARDVYDWATRELQQLATGSEIPLLMGGGKK